MELAEYTYVKDTVLKGDIEEGVISLQTANGSRFTFTAIAMHDGSFQKSRYQLKDDSANGFVVIIDRERSNNNAYYLPIGAIELLTIKLTDDDMQKFEEPLVDDGTTEEPVTEEPPVDDGTTEEPVTEEPQP